MKKLIVASIIGATVLINSAVAQFLNQVQLQAADDGEEENLNLSGRCKESKENGYRFRCVIAPITQNK
jgi:hypothetical protein